MTEENLEVWEEDLESAIVNAIYNHKATREQIVNRMDLCILNIKHDLKKMSERL
jgi:hypothetical protein